MGPGRGGGGTRAYTVLRHRDYRLLWGAELVSTLGSQTQRVAIAWQVFELTGDPLQLGLLGLFRFVPVFAFGLVGGVVADRRDRRRTLLATQSVLLLTSALLAGLTITGAASIAWIYGVTFVSATVGAVGNPARQALIPALVPRGEIAGAMSMSIFGSQVAAVSGPALGGLTIGVAGVATAYVLDAVTFAAVIAAALAIRARPTVVAATGSGLAAAIEGLRFLRGSPILLGVMSVDFLATFFGASTYLMPVFAEEILGVGPQGLGLLLAAPAAGAVLGSVAMGSIRMPARPGAGVLLAVAAYGACILGFGLSRHVGLSLAFLAASGAADAVSMALRHTVRNLATPDALRGRIAAAHSTFAMGGPQLGEFEAGAVAAVAGAGTSVALGGLGTLLTVAVVARRVPAIARYRVTGDTPPDPRTATPGPHGDAPPVGERPAPGGAPPTVAD